MTTNPPDRLDRVEAILELLATETLANAKSVGESFAAIAEIRTLQADNARAIADNTQAISRLTEELLQQKRTVDYLISRDG